MIDFKKPLVRTNTEQTPVTYVGPVQGVADRHVISYVQSQTGQTIEQLVDDHGRPVTHRSCDSLIKNVPKVHTVYVHWIRYPNGTVGTSTDIVNRQGSWNRWSRAALLRVDTIQYTEQE